MLVSVVAGLLLLSNVTEDMQRARVLYLQAVAGDRAAARDGEKLLELLAKESPEHVQIAAYQGSLDVLESGRTMALWKRASLAKRGLEKLDRAVSLAPKAAEVRFLRAVSTFHLPGFFGRDQQCRDDFSFIAQHVSELDANFAAAAHYHHGLLLDKDGNHSAARNAWRRSVETAPQSRSAHEAAKKLAR